MKDTADQGPATKQIAATHTEGHYTLDELLGNETDLLGSPET